MPIYEYSCSKCGKTIEVIQKLSDPPLTTHKSCGGQLTKLISAAGFQFKGTGWYVTDYARKGTEPNRGEKVESGKTESSSNGKQDTGTDKPSKAPVSESASRDSKESKKSGDS
jgi:putative FmdB family regulatory protein